MTNLNAPIERVVTRVYQDPLDLIWLGLAAQLGMQVVRSSEVFAYWDGQRRLTLGTSETLDADDSLAQMIFHELCHATIEGPESWNQPDWGLDFECPEHRVHEHAALRLQAALADQYALRKFLAATTNFREYYDRIPADAFSDRDDPAVNLARKAFFRANSENWFAKLKSALASTQMIAKIVQPWAHDGSLWTQYATTSSDD